MEIIIGIILLIILFPLLLVNIKSNDIDFNGNDFEILYKAKMLLKYCLEHNIDVPEEIIESLTIDTDYDKLNDQQRKNVWMAYNELNKLIKEISVENVFNVVYHKRQSNLIRQYLSKIFKSIKPKYTSNAKILIRNFHAFGLIILVLTILVHGYSTQGSQHLRSLEKNWEVKLNKVITDDSTVNNEIKYRDLFKEIEAKTYFLAQWNRIWVTSMIPISEELQKLTDRSKETYELYEKLDEFRDSTRKKPIQTIQEIENNYFFIKNLTKYALVPMTSFLLPFLYAMLGSLAFVVRDLSYKLKKDMLLSRSFTNVGVRLFTGSLAGLTIGMFISDSGSSPITVQNLSSDALAFLAGYNIELLFHTMDTIIQAITGKRLVDGVDDESLNKLAQRVKELNDG